MTPAKALEIIEGKAARQESATKNSKPGSLMSHPRGFSLSWDIFTNPLVIAGLAILLAVIYLWKYSAIASDAYKKGFEKASISLGAQLSSAQKDLEGQVGQVGRLQQDLGKSEENILQLQQELVATQGNLASANQQKDQLAQKLKATEDSIPGQIGAVAKPLKNEIKEFGVQLSQAENEIRNRDKNIGSLQDAFTQMQQERDIATAAMMDKERQLAAAQKEISDKAGQSSRLAGDLSKSQDNAALLQKELAQAKDDLLASTEQKEELSHQLAVLQSQQSSKSGTMCSSSAAPGT